MATASVDPSWDWEPEEAQRDADRRVLAAANGPDTGERPMPGSVDRAADVIMLESVLGHDRLVSAMAGGATLASDRGAWVKARKALSDYKRGRRGVKKGVGEPYRSRLNTLLPAARREERDRSRRMHAGRMDALRRAGRVRVKAVIHGRVSNKDKRLNMDTDVSGDLKNQFLQYALRGDSEKAIFVGLYAWGGGLEYRVTKIYEVEDVSIDPA